jgi:threonine/homoserine efflux transporter RhtA
MSAAERRAHPCIWGAGAVGLVVAGLCVRRAAAIAVTLFPHVGASAW